MKIGELRMLELLVELGAPGFFKERKIFPQAARSGALRIGLPGFEALLIRWIVLLLRIHMFAVGFVIPPDVAEIRRHHVGAGMNVADDALAGGNGAGELVFDGVPRLVVRNCRINLGTVPLVSVLGVGSGMNRRTIVGVDHMTCGATAVAIIAGMIVGARHG